MGLDSALYGLASAVAHGDTLRVNLYRLYNLYSIYMSFWTPSCSTDALSTFSWNTFMAQKHLKWSKIYGRHPTCALLRDQ
jgi:hypothetical protein